MSGVNSNAKSGAKLLHGKSVFVVSDFLLMFGTIVFLSIVILLPIFNFVILLLYF
jgi:hypothetical protein